MARLVPILGAVGVVSAGCGTHATARTPPRQPELDTCLGVEARPDAAAVARAYAALARGERLPATPLCVDLGQGCEAPPAWRDVRAGEVTAMACAASGHYAIVSAGTCARSRAPGDCGFVVLDVTGARAPRFFPPLPAYRGDRAVAPELVGDRLVVRTASGYAILSGDDLGTRVDLPYRALALAPDQRSWLVLDSQASGDRLGVASAPGWTSPGWVGVDGRAPGQPIAKFLEGGAVAVFDPQTSRSAGLALDTARAASLAGPGTLAIDPGDRFAVVSATTYRRDAIAADHVLVRADGHVEHVRAVLPAGTPQDNVASIASANAYVFASQSRAGIRLDVFSLKPFALRHTLHPFGDRPYENADLYLAGDTVVVVAVEALAGGQVQYRFATIRPARGEVVATGVAGLANVALDADHQRVALRAPADGGGEGALVIAPDGTVTRVASARGDELAPFAALPAFRVAWAARSDCDGVGIRAATTQLRAIDDVLFPRAAATCPAH